MTDNIYFKDKYEEASLKLRFRKIDETRNYLLDEINIMI